MNIVNGKEQKVVELLRGYGLNGYEAKVYFTLLVAGESKANDIARKAGVPQSKVYDVLDRLASKGFAEQAESVRPSLYKAYALRETTEKVVAQRTREIAQIRKSIDKLNQVIEAVAPIHRRHDTFRLFAPRYRTWKTEIVASLDEKITLSETVMNRPGQALEEQGMGYKRKTTNVRL